MFLTTKLRSIVNKIRRPSAVNRAQKEHVRLNPKCAACGGLRGVQGHHIAPYNKYPEKAADPDNFISLCEALGGPECHLHVGHGGDFRFFNPNVVADAAAFLDATTDASRSVIMNRARACRLVDA